MTARFITIEGIEGVGKSTNVEFVADYFRQRGETVIVTREPGGTELAERIRNLILDTPGDGLSDTGELLLIIKTQRDCYPALEAAILALHPYELPEIVTVPLDGGLPAYLDWINSSTSKCDD